MRIELVTDINGKTVQGLSGMKALADTGNLEALNFLGEWMMMGFECSPDPVFFSSCFMRAAQGGNARAMRNLASCYMEGYGVEPSFYAAKRWIMAAIENHDGEAVNLLSTLYLTTIGSHQPDIDDYVDTLYALDPSGQTLYNLAPDILSDILSVIQNPEERKEAAKKRIRASLVGKNRGKNAKEIRQFKDDITKEDLQGFARLSDIHYDDMLDWRENNRDIGADAQIALQNIEHLCPTADYASLRDSIQVLYQLSESKDKELTEKFVKLLQRSMRLDNKEIKTVKEALHPNFSWTTQAIYGFDSGLYSSVDPDTIAIYAKKIASRLNDLDDAEILEKYERVKGDWRLLYDLQNDIQQIDYYGTEVVEIWVRRILSEVAKLQDSMVENCYTQNSNDYFTLVSLYQTVSDAKIQKSVQEKWIPLLSETIIPLQRAYSEKICNRPANKSQALK